MNVRLFAMTAILAMLAAIMLAGCSHAPRGVEVRTVEVPVVTVEKCIALSDVPRLPPRLGRRTSSDARVLADRLLAKVMELQVYAARADVLLRMCAADELPNNT